jgi:tripartite-type tricarboxylate transporter receptor subunit TctC
MHSRYFCNSCLWTLVSLAFAGTGFIHTAAMAQSFPVKPIRMVVPFVPGGASDVVARVVTQRLSGLLGQQVIVDYRGGAGGSIGAEYVAKSPADGYTLLLANPGPSVINPLLQPKGSFDSLRDITPIVLMTVSPMVLVVHQSMPIKDVKELIAYVRSKPGKINYGSSGTGAITHLTMEYFKARTKLDMVHVPYKGASASLTAIMGGEVSLMFAALGSLQGVLETKKVRILAVAAPERMDLIPGVLTVSENGVPDFNSMNWFGVVGPPNTPRSVVDLLNREINRVVRSEEAREQYNQLGFIPRGSTPEEFERHIKAEIELWGKLIKSQGIKAN